MDREEFTRRLLAELKHLTMDEQSAVRQEIEGHMEDRIEGLVELGCSREVAEERTLAAMGDPVEIGRELDRQYPPGWLWLGRAAATLTALTCVVALLAIGMCGFFINSLTARFFPPETSSLQLTSDYSLLDIRVQVGNDILRVTRVSVGKKSDAPGVLLAEVSFCTYDRIPGGTVSQALTSCTFLEDQRGERHSATGSGLGNWKRECASRRVEIQPGDAYVALCYDHLGERFRLEIPLPHTEEVEP